MIRKAILGCAYGLFVATSAAQGPELDYLSGIYVERWNGSSWVAVSGFPTSSQSGLPSGSSITIPSSVSTCRIFAVDPSTTDIGNITVSGSPSSPTIIIARVDREFEPRLD